MKLYKRNSALDKTILLDSSLQDLKSDGMYLTLLDYHIPKNNRYSSLQINVEGDFLLTKGMLSFDLIEDMRGAEKKSINYNSTAFYWYFGLKKNYSLNCSSIVKLDDNQNKTLKFYMYNPELGEAKLTSMKIKIQGIKK